ncbi:MAG: porphobilinogen synthase [Alphaproteobacteria bacterium]|nr:porphobilinogen synthase [Alphaproteobacteria bacterium]
MFPSTRMRRLRGTPAMRAMLRETSLSADDLIYPIFVDEEIETPVPIKSMPGISRIPEAMIPDTMAEVRAAGVSAVLLFGVSHHKDATGSDTMREDGLVARMVRSAKMAAPEMLIIADTCFCEFTDHGHCGVLVDGHVHNDQTLENLAVQAVIAARAGVDIVAPSGMMDGAVAAIRRALDEAGFTDVAIMSYSTKFASEFYGPFREAAGSSLQGDRKTHQIQSGNLREGLRESRADEAEGADMLMVKPGMPYLDVLYAIRQETLLPLGVYQISGEYAMIKFASQAGALDEKAVMMESLLGFKRAGADWIITYFALDAARLLKS